MKDCDTCLNRGTCSRDIGIMFGGCSVHYKPDTDALHARLDNLEGCEDNPVYAAEVKEIRSELSEIEEAAQC